MAAHSSIIAWRIPWTEEPGGLYSPWGCKRVRHDLETKQQQLGSAANTRSSTYYSCQELFQGFPGGAVVKNLLTNAGDVGLTPGLRGSHVPWSS